MKEVLEISNLSIAYQTKKTEVVAVKNLTFFANKGEFVAIIGRSGCGKTSILSALAGLLPYKGTVKVNGEKISKPLSSTGYMLQRDELFEWLTIEENILLPIKIRKLFKDKRLINHVYDLIKKYGLSEFSKSYPNELSGGMRQRAALIRTLACSPDILLLDEPFSALDYQTRLAVCDDVYSIIKTEGKTALLVTHDISEAISVADRIIVLTARPASVYTITTIELDKNLSPLKRREQQLFSSYFEKLWRDLNA